MIREASRMTKNATALIKILDECFLLMKRQIMRGTVSASYMISEASAGEKD